MDIAEVKNSGLTLFQEVHRAFLEPVKVLPLTGWAYNKIQDKDAYLFLPHLFQFDVTSAQNFSTFMCFLTQRIVVIAMPIFALFDAALCILYLPISGILSIFPMDLVVGVSTCAFYTLKILGICLASILSMPIALVVPTKVYLLNCQWNSISKAYQTLDTLDNTLASFREESPNQEKVKSTVKELSKNICYLQGPDQISKAAEAINKLNEDFSYISNDEEFKNAKLKLEMASLASDLSSLNKNALAESIRKSLHSEKMIVYFPDLVINNELDTYDNKIPNFIWNMRYLQSLHVRDTGYLPSVKGLSELKNSIPPEISQLTNLTVFSWTQSDIKSVPTEIGRLSNLQLLSLNGNSNLESLPLSLGQIPNLMYIDIEGTKIPQEQCDAILAQCEALRETAIEEQLPGRLESWKIFGNSEIDLSEIKNFDKEKRLLIDEWLRRLEITKDFNSDSQKFLAETVCQILNSVINDDVFRELFFVQINANLERCGDRAGMAFNEIYTVWELSQLSSEASTNEKLRVMRQGAMTLALRAAIAKQIDQHQKQTDTIEREAAQIYLYYESSLRNELNLLSAIKTMLYQEIGKRDWIDRASLIDEVNKNYLDYLMDLPVFKELIKNDSEYIAECEAQTKPLKDKINDLKEPQGVDSLSPEYLDWQHQIGELNTQINTAINRITKKWTKDRL